MAVRRRKKVRKPNPDLAPPVPEKEEKRSMIRWTDAEKDEIADGVLGLLMKEPDSRMHTLVNRIQAQLPQDRQRSGINCIFQVPWLAKMLVERFQALKAKADVADALQEPEPEPPPATEPEITKEDVLEDITTEELLAILFSRLTSHLGAFEKNILGSLAAVSANRLIQPQNGHREEERKKKITIIGLIGSQTEEMKTRFHNRCAFQFIPANRKSKNLPQADRTFLMIKFIDHVWDDAVKQRIAKGKYERINGGMSSLVERVQSFLED